MEIIRCVRQDLSISDIDIYYLSTLVRLCHKPCLSESTLIHFSVGSSAFWSVCERVRKPYWFVVKALWLTTSHCCVLFAESMGKNVGIIVCMGKCL